MLTKSSREWPEADPEAVSRLLHWEVHGKEGDPLILLHGLGANGFTWNRWIPELARTHRVFVVEMMGFGSSPKPLADRYGPASQAAFLHRLILELDLFNLTLIGHSLGGGVALLTARWLQDEDPLRVTRVVAVSGAAVRQRVSPYIRLARRPYLAKAFLRLTPPRVLVREVLKRAYYDPGQVDDTLVDAYAQPLRSREARHALAATARHLVVDDLEEPLDHLRSMTLPTLLIWGDADRIVPLESGRRLLDILPNATLEILPRCGHVPQEERAEESLALVRRFLAEAG